MRHNGKDDTKGMTTRDVNAAQRATLALELRAQRLSYDEIARRCGYSGRQSAHKAVQRELSRVVVPGVEEMRKEEMVFLDSLQARVWKRLEDPRYEKSMLFAVDRLLQIAERRAKLLGLDTPVDQAQYMNMVVVQEVPQNYLAGGPTQG